MDGGPTMEIISKKLKIVSIKNFYHVNFLYRLKVDYIIEKNYKNRSKNGYVGGMNGDFNYKIINPNDKFFDKLYDRFLTYSKNIFGDFSVSSKNQTTCWCYRSIGENYILKYHDHKMTSTINGVYYYKLNQGDSISFLQDDEEFVYHPEQEEMLIFPNDLLHKPNKPTKDCYRYSINMEIKTNELSHQIFREI